MYLKKPEDAKNRIWQKKHDQKFYHLSQTSNQILRFDDLIQSAFCERSTLLRITRALSGQTTTFYLSNPRVKPFDHLVRWCFIDYSTYIFLRPASESRIRWLLSINLNRQSLQITQKQLNLSNYDQWRTWKEYYRKSCRSNCEPTTCVSPFCVTVTSGFIRDLDSRVVSR